MKFKIIDLPNGLLAMIDQDGTILVNAKHLEQLDEVLHNRDGLPSAKALPAYYDAVDTHYSEMC